MWYDNRFIAIKMNYWLIELEVGFLGLPVLFYNFKLRWILKNVISDNPKSMTSIMLEG